MLDFFLLNRITVVHVLVAERQSKSRRRHSDNEASRKAGGQGNGTLLVLEEEVKAMVRTLLVLEEEVKAMVRTLQLRAQLGQWASIE